MSNAVAISRPRISVKFQTLAALIAIAAAVALPQVAHGIGAVMGMGTAVGETFLPMHLPIIIVGLLAGPYAGLIAGAASPLISFALSGMPPAAMLPFMIVELAVYGLTAGLLRRNTMPTIFKVLITQAAGRAARMVAMLIAVNAIGMSSLDPLAVWTGIGTGLAGLILQWTFIPLIIYWVEHRKA